MIFAFYFFAVVIVGATNIGQARSRCLTPTARRRMGYLAISFAGPALGVFPYMLLTTLPAAISESVLLSVLLVGNVGVAVMIVTLAYTVAYFGALILGRDAGSTPTVADRAAFVAGAGLASLSWQTLLAGMGALAKQYLSPRFQMYTSVAGNLVVIGLGLRVVVQLLT